MSAASSVARQVLAVIAVATVTSIAFTAGLILGVLALVPFGAFDDEVRTSTAQVVFVYVLACGFAILADLLFARRLWGRITGHGALRRGR